MLELKEEIKVVVDGVPVAKFNKMIDALTYVQENRIKEKVKFETKREYVNA